MHLLLFGPNTYLARQKLEEIKKKYLEKSGDVNLSVLDVEQGLDFEKYLKEVATVPFLAKTRLVIVKNLFRFGKPNLKEKVKKSLKKISQSSVVIFYEEGEINKSDSLFLSLRGPKISQEFTALSERERERWVEKKIKEKGGEIDPEALLELVTRCEDQWRLDCEIEKLLLFAGKKTIKEEDVEYLVKARDRANLFGFLDLLAAQKSGEALGLLKPLLQSGEKEGKILAMIAFQFKNLLIVKDFLEKGLKTQEIIAKSGLHPFVCRKTLALSPHFDLGRLKENFNLITQLEIELKTGKIEPRLGLDLLVFRLTK